MVKFRFRIISVILSFVLMFTGVDMSAFAYEPEEADFEVTSRKIIDIKELSGEITTQKLAVGSSESDISFPENLVVTIEEIRDEEIKKAAEKTSDEEEAAEEESKSEEGLKDSKDNKDKSKEDVKDKENQSEKNVKEEDQSKEENKTEVEEKTEEEEDQSEENDKADEEDKSEENNNEDSIEDGEAKEEGTELSFIGDIFSPITVYAAEEEPDDEAEYETVTESVITARDIVLEDVEWTIDAERSSGAEFSSLEEGAVFYYVPVIPDSYRVDTDIPAITVEIISPEDEEIFEFLVLESDGVKVEGYLPKNTVLEVTPMSVDEAQELLGDADKEVVVAFDITLKVDGEEIEPDDSVRVTISAPESVDMDAIDTDSLELIHVTDDMTNDVVDVDVTDQGEFVFEAESFSPWMITVNKVNEEIDYIERAEGKTFDQTIRVHFADASLVKDGDKIRLTVWGNIGSEKVKDGSGESTDLIQLFSDEFDINITRTGDSSTASADCRITGIPVYIIGKTGDATKDGNGTYQMPSDFYGVQINTVSGYTPDNGSGVDSDYLKLRPVKDANDAVWTTSTLTIENSILGLVNPSFTMDWQDNRNFAGARPYTDGDSIRSDEIAGKIKLYYKNGDEYVSVEQNPSVLVKENSDKPTVRVSSFSTWSVNFSSLPKDMAGETPYEWYAGLSEDFFDGIGTYYQVIGLNSDGLIRITEDEPSKIEFKYTSGVTGYITWRADGNDEDITLPDMPEDGLFSGMQLWKKEGEQAPVDITDSDSYQINWTSTGSDEQTIWTYEITGLPFYTGRGDAIVYYVKMENSSFTIGDSRYKFIYDNGKVSSETDKCYSGQNIYATVIDDADFSFNISWYDDNDNTSVLRRKSAIDGGITLYLWRYPSNKGIEEGAPVTKDAKQYTYTLNSATDAGDESDNTIEISGESFLGEGSLDKLPKYDEAGFRYIYYVTEVASSDLYKIFYYNGTDEFKGTSTDRAAKDGGIICNVRSARVAPTITKIWKASSSGDYIGSSSTFSLQKEENGEWRDLGNEVTLTGFSSSKKRVTGVFDVQDLYDGLGRSYNLRVVETEVKAGNGQEAEFSENGWEPEGDAYSAVFGLGDYTYKAVSTINVSVEDGAEAAEAEVTNKLYGTKELTIIKNWSGDWNIGNAGSKTGDVTFELFRQVGAGEKTLYATVVMEKPANGESEISGTGRFTFTRSDEGALPQELDYTIDGDGSRWTTSAVEVPAYTDEGEQYNYTITETGVSTQQSFGTEYTRDITGKEIKLTARNYTGSFGNKIRYDANTVWKDDSDTFQRSDVKVEFGNYSDDGTFEPLMGDDNSPLALTLTAQNDYSGYIWIDKNESPSIRVSLTGEYERAVEGARITAGQLDGGFINAIADSDNGYYRPGYEVSVTRNSQNTSFTITNTRKGLRSFKFEKNWIDSANILGLRGDSLRIALFREENGVETELAHKDIQTYSDPVKKILNDDLVAILDNTDAEGNPNYYEAYDEDGKSYIYYIKEYIVNGDSVQEVSVNATKQTTTTGYVVNSIEENTVYGLESDALATNLLITDEFKYTNMAAGERTEVPFYLIWHDPAKADERPDVYFTLYYDGGEGESIIPYTGSYTERWVDVEEGNKYVQKAVFGGLPAADDTGRVYSYYVALTLNNATSTYSVDNYTVPLFSVGSTSVYNAQVVKKLEKTINGIDHLRVVDGTEKSDVKSDGVFLTKEESFAVIGIYDTIKIEGRKLWLDVPEGITADKLPMAEIYLFRDSLYDQANAVPAESNVNDDDAKKDIYAGNAVPEISEGDGSASPQILNEAKSQFIFGTYDSQQNPASYAEFPKYDEMGFLYTYKVREIIYNVKEHEIPADIMIPSYSDNTADLTNVYKLATTKNSRPLKITVDWDIARQLDPEKEKNAKATVRLYRRELDSDGNGYTGGGYANDEDPADKASSAKAATLFSLGNTDPEAAGLELIEEIVIPVPENGTSSELTRHVPVFAPSGMIYAYYAIEMTDDMPGFTAVVDGSSSDHNTEISNAVGEPGYIGVAFANSGIDIAASSSADNLKEVTFKNTYNTATISTITFTQKWNSSFADMIPDPSAEDAPVKFTVKATAASQDKKDNANTVTFNEDAYDLTIVSVDGNGEWKYTIDFGETPVPVYSANGNPYVYSVVEELNSVFAKENYQPITKTISETATVFAEAQNTGNEPEISTPLKNSLKGKITVSKRWDDYSNDYGMREGSVLFAVDYRVGDAGTWSVYADKDGATEFTLSTNNGWSSVLDALPVSSKAGEKYQYRIKETKIITGGENNASDGLEVEAPANYSYDQNYKWTRNGTTSVDTDSFYEPISVGNYKVYNPADITDISGSKSVKIVNQLDTDDAVTRLKVVKRWVDDDNKYGLRQSPITIEIQNSRDGAVWNTVTRRVINNASALQSDSNVWEKTFENLPKYFGPASEQNTFRYRAVEIDSDESYEITHDWNEENQDYSEFVTEISGTLLRREGDIQVQMHWNDESASHEDTQVALYSSNFSTSGKLEKLRFTGNEQTLSDSNTSIVYEDLPEFNKEGDPIVYQVKEITEGSFKTQYISAEGDWPGYGETPVDAPLGTAADSDIDTYFTVINTPLISLTGTKTWEDDENAYGLRPSGASLKLQRIAYDQVVDGKTAIGQDWEDVDLAELKKTNAQATSDTFSMAESFAPVRVDKLPLYDLSYSQTPVKYRYRLYEASAAPAYDRKSGTDNGYEYGDGATDNQTSNVTDVLARRGAITVNKKWNTDGTVDDKSVTVKLYSRNFTSGVDDGTSALSPVERKEAAGMAELSGDITGNGSYSFTDLPLRNKDGNMIGYYVEESAGDDSTAVYFTKIAGVYEETGTDRAASTDGEALDVRIVNTSFTNASVEVKWADSSNRFETRPDTVYAKLQRREGTSEFEDMTRAMIPDNNTAGEKVIVLLNAASSWSRTIDKLPSYKRTNGDTVTKYEYRFVQCDEQGNAYVPAGYDESYAQSGIKTEITNELITKDISVEKIWVDDNNRREKRPEEIKITIQRSLDDGQTWEDFITDETITGAAADLFNENKWTGVFEDLPKYVYGPEADPENPSEIWYRAVEDMDHTYGEDLVLRNYYTGEAEVNGDSTVITNTAVDYHVSLSIEKEWEDSSDKYGFRPDEITVMIKRSSDNGVTWEDFGSEVISSADADELNSDKWVKVFDSLPRYYGKVEDDIPYLYKAEETDVDSAYDASYETDIRQIDEEHFETVIKNTLDEDVLIIDLDINSREGDENFPENDFEFPFVVSINNPDGDESSFAGEYYLYNKEDVEALTEAELKEDVLSDISTISRESKVAGDGIVYLKIGQVAVLKGIRRDWTYEVTQNPTQMFHEVEKVTNNGQTVIYDENQETNGTDAVGISKDTETMTNYGYARGSFMGSLGDPAHVSLVLVTFDQRNSRLGIINTTPVESEQDLKGGKVKIYDSGIAVDSDDMKDADSTSYTDKETGFIEKAMSVQFKPDDNFTYSDTIAINWWKEGDDVTAVTAPDGQRIEISNYLYEDEESKEMLPYTGRLIKGDDGEIQCQSDFGDDFRDAWAPLIENGPFTDVTILKGSVVLTLASSSEQMPVKTLVEVSFVPQPAQTEPEVPENPEEQETPEAPVTPVTPVTPGVPTTPETSETPKTPENSDTPKTPETPATPETPKTPEISETPKTPAVTPAPSTGSQPANGDTKTPDAASGDNSQKDKTNDNSGAKTPALIETPGVTDENTSQSGDNSESNSDEIRHEESSSEKSENESRSETDSHKSDNNKTQLKENAAELTEDEKKEYSGVRTGDDTPLNPLASLFTYLLLAFAFVLALFKRSKDRED